MLLSNAWIAVQEFYVLELFECLLELIILSFFFLQCLELYTYEGEDQRVGFYSLEMAADLELEPKPNHVIAFQDPGDCKNFCYILQGHLEMLGKGKAFIVPQPPKVRHCVSHHCSLLFTCLPFLKVVLTVSHDSLIYS